MAAATLMTAEEFLALPPNDQVERWLCRGELREHPMPYRNRFHSTSMVSAGTELKNWLRTQPEPRGQIVGGDAGFRLPGEPNTLVGIDLAYVSAETLARSPVNSTVIVGAPVLAVEILSPSDTKESIDEKLELYLEAGVPLIWLLDTRFRTVTIHAPGRDPQLLAGSAELTAEPHLPGFRVPVPRLFE